MVSDLSSYKFLTCMRSCKTTMQDKVSISNVKGRHGSLMVKRSWCENE